MFVHIFALSIENRGTISTKELLEGFRITLVAQSMDTRQWASQCLDYVCHHSYSGNIFIASSVVKSLLGPNCITHLVIGSVVCQTKP